LDLALGRDQRQREACLLDLFEQARHKLLYRDIHRWEVKTGPDCEVVVTGAEDIVAQPF
jgi:hypothetical protein